MAVPAVEPHAPVNASLTRMQCLELLQVERAGLLVLVHDGTTRLPVRYELAGEDVLLTADTQLDCPHHHRGLVCLQVDGEDRRGRWSVVAAGGLHGPPGLRLSRVRLVGLRVGVGTRP